MDIFELPLDQVMVGDRLRQIDEDQARLIGLSMAEDGQRTPIEVRANHAGSLRPFRLVAGGHRYRGAEIAGLPTIRATLFEGTDLQARLAEIDENLIRHELTALDRAVFLAERQDVYEQMNPNSRKQTRLKQGDVQPISRSANLAERAFTADAAERLGWSERSIQRAIRLCKAITPSVRARLSGTAWADNGSELEALAKLAPDEQLKVAGMLVDPQNQRPRNVANAVRMARGEPEPIRERSGYDEMMSLWRKGTTAEERGRFIDFLVAEKTVARVKGAR